MTTHQDFSWTTYYMAFADKLLTYQNNRTALLTILEEVYAELHLKYPFTDHGEPIEDICPFTVFGCFNKGMTDENRTNIAREIGNRIGVSPQAPDSFAGIPIVNNMNAWFFAYKDKRAATDIPNLWELFDIALQFADEASEQNKQRFQSMFDTVASQYGVKWTITMGLYWMRPFNYLNLDEVNRTYLLDNENYADMQHMTHLKDLPDGETYVELLDYFEKQFQMPEAKNKSFPEISYNAWMDSKAKQEEPPQAISDIVNKGKRRYWIYSPGANASMWEAFYQEGIMGIVWGGLGNLKQYATKEDMKNRMKALYGEEYTYRNAGHATWQFANELKPGDVVYVKKGRRLVIGYGIVASEYIYDESREVYKHIHKVNWKKTGEFEHPGQAVNKALTDITPYTDYVRKLQDLFIEEREIDEEDMEEVYETYTKGNFLDEAFMEEEAYHHLVNLLQRKKNLILQGAPGVGKTFLAKRLAYSVMNKKDDSRVKMIQFHQSYSYEDFMMGFRPTENGFTLTEGPFYAFCKEAELDSDRDYFFIIDEINRGNLSQIFGELLMLLENDKRGQELRLIYQDELFSIPKNVYIIGMMNTADRSLAIIDYALRRRFSFYTMEPAFESEGFKAMMDQINNKNYNRLIATIKSLNNDIVADDSLGTGFQIGHSYFCTDEAVTDNWLYLVIEYELLPLLEEYWFDEPEKLQMWTNKLRDILHD